MNTVSKANLGIVDGVQGTLVWILDAKGKDQQQAEPGGGRGATSTDWHFIELSR